jgi:RND family efflux transporter MFP subunit
MRRWLFVLIPALALFSLIGWRISQKRADTANQAKQRQARSTAAALVQTATATRRDIVQTFEAVGSVEAPHVVNLTPQITGRLLSLAVHEGDSVTAGQMLAQIDPEEVEANVRNKQAALAGTQQRLAQAQVTQNAQNVGVGTDIRRQEAGLASARATLAQATADENAQIAAAQDAVTQAQGQVGAANASIGNADAAIKSAQANLANARTNLERQQSLYEQGATAKENYDNAQTQADVAQAALDQAQQQRQNALASLQSATAAKRSTQHNVDIVRNKASTDIAAAQAGVGQAAASLKASQANTANIPAYQRNIDALQAAVNAAEADLHAAQAQLGYTVIRSPLTGVVTQRNLDPGGVATPGQPLLTLQAIRQVWVTAGVPEEVSRHVYVGQETDCDFDALPGETFHGRITQVNPAADPQSRQFQIRVRLDNPGYHIKPGMFGRIRLETDRVRGAVTVPLEAVKFSAGDRTAGANTQQTATATVVGADNKAEVRKVETGASDNRYIAITSGLQEGEKVVTVTSRALKDGQNVRTADAVGTGSDTGRGTRGRGAAGSGDTTTPSEGGPAR